MGMYDIVYFPCPTCGARVEDQFKGGECSLRCIPISDAPADVLSGLDLVGTCGTCNNSYRLVITRRFVVETRVHVERA